MANYLYNGVAVPTLPEYDNERYPYAVLRKNTGATKFAFFVSSHAPTIKNGKLQVLQLGAGASGRCEAYTYTDADGWIGPTTYTFVQGFTTDAEGVFWTNTDILNEDGTIYLAASEPVPIGGGEPIDPTSFMQGYIVGRRLAGMRK